MKSELDELRVAVAPAPPFFESLEPHAASVARRVESELAELLRDLGIAREPTVRLEVARTNEVVRPIRLTIDDRPCLFPGRIVADALAYVAETPQILADAEAVAAGIQALDADRAAELVASVCRAAVSAQPGLLLGASDDRNFRAAVELGMSVAGRARGLGDSAEQTIAASARDVIDIHIDPGCLRTLAVDEVERELFTSTREQLFLELGLPLPPFHFHLDSSLRPGAFAFRINAVRSLPRIGLPADAILVDLTPETVELFDVDAQPTLNPGTYRPAALAAAEHKELLDGSGITTWGPIGFLVLCLAAAVRRNALSFMTSKVAAAQLARLGFAFPFLKETADAHAPSDALAPVLRELLLDALPIRNLRRIVELMLRYETDDPNRGDDRAAFVRSGLSDLIGYRAADEPGAVTAYLLDPETERALSDYATGARANGTGESLAERLSAALSAELARLDPGASTPAVVTRGDLRRPLRTLLRPEFPELKVLAESDLPPAYIVRPVGQISLVEAPGATAL